MGLFTFIIGLLVLLLILIIIGTIQEFTLWVVTRKSREFVIMMIPALISLIVFSIVMFLTYYILDLFNINTLNLVYSKIMNFEYSFHNTIYIIIGYSIAIIVFIILQALCLKLVNINYTKISDFIKYKILKKEDVKGLGSSTEDKDEKSSVNLTNNFLPALPKKKTPFFHYIAASLFSFAIVFFSIFSLIYIGIMLGEKYII